MVFLQVDIYAVYAIITVIRKDDIIKKRIIKAKGAWYERR